MYNRYIPQPDGSFRRNRMPEPPRPMPEQKPECKPACKTEPEPEPCLQSPVPPCASGQPRNHPRPPRRPPCPPPKPSGCQQPPPGQSTGVFSFFRQMLPRDFCTEDLLVVLLLLLMAGDCKEDQNTALLTLALYLFL